MQPLNRSEKIQLARGILQAMGIILMLICLAIMIKYRVIFFKPCYWQNDNGSLEETGLYGNCDWLNEKMHPERYEPSWDANQMKNQTPWNIPLNISSEP
jgi:hypothetical protein